MSLWDRNIMSHDQARALENLVQRGLVYIDPYTGRFTAQSHGRIDNAFIYVGHSANCRACFLWNKIMFRIFGLVPSFCRFDCYKVVVKPRTVIELKQLWDLTRAIPFFYDHIMPPQSKFGINRRPYVFGPYGAYYYCNGLEDGLGIHSLVRDAICKHHPAGEALASTVILKKACTEMEMQYGPTNLSFWQDMPDNELHLQRKLEDMFDFGLESPIMPDWLQNKIFNDWLDFARMNGDSTGDEAYGDRATHSVSYHNIDLKSKDKGGGDTNDLVDSPADPLPDECIT